MNAVVLVALNLVLVGLSFFLLKQRGFLTYYRSGRLWLTWLGIGIITLMDEFTSIFYVPAESYRFIGSSAIVFIALTSILIRFLSTRFVEIAEILEHHGLIGGGVYSFSYLVLGPTVSFVAISSIMVDYILTACISAVSAVLNASSFFPALSNSPHLVMTLVFVSIWFVAGLNILGIRENVRFTFAIFIFAALVILNLLASGFLNLDQGSMERIRVSGHLALASVQEGSWLDSYGSFIKNIAFCILAYSGIESVIQTAGFVENWRVIKKAYVFLAMTVGLVTPLVAVLALSAPIQFAQHEGDLITHFATLVNGVWFGVVVAVLASVTLLMAVNTAFVASSELIERVAHRYGFQWIIATNRKNSLYRIHVMDGILFSIIVLITSGSQAVLADMYAIGSGGQLLHQHGLASHLPLLHGHQGGHPVFHQPPGDPGPVCRADQLFRVSRLGQTARHGALGHPHVRRADRRDYRGQEAPPRESRSRAGRERDGRDSLPSRGRRSRPEYLLQPSA